MKSVLKAIRAHKILSVIILSAIVLFAGGFTAFKIIMNNIAEPPQMETSPESFDYETVGSLKGVFALSEEEKARAIETYSAEEGFSVYKKAFYNFLNTEKYRVLTTGQTNVDTMGGILVNITNEKKFDGTNFFMHLISSAAVEGTFANMSNNDAMHYLYVTENNSNNLATIKILDVNDVSVVKSKTVFTEKDYVYNFGAIPYIACNFIIRENTVESSSFSFDETTGLYKIDMRLNAVLSTEGLIKQMHAVSGTDASYENGSVTYTAYVDENFIIRRTEISETYQVSTMGLKFNGVSETSEAFFYEGDDDFIPLLDDEKYDLTDVPVKEDDGEITLSKEISSAAIAKVKAEGVNADFSLSAGDISLDGRLQVIFGEETLIRIDTAIKGIPISLYLSLDQTKSGALIADVKGFKAGLNFERIGNVLCDILPEFGIDVSDMPIGDIINGINISGIIDAFANVKGSKISDNVFVYDLNLNATGIPLDVPISMTVDNGKIVSFRIVNQDVLGKKVNFSLTPSNAEKDLASLTVGNGIADLSGILSYIREEDFCIATIKDIIESKTFVFNFDAKVKDYQILGSAAIDFKDLSSVKVSATFTVDGNKFDVYYAGGEISVKCEDIALSTTLSEIKDCVAVFFDSDIIPEDLTELLMAKAPDILNSLSYSAGALKLGYEKLSVTLTPAKLSVSYGDDVTADITDITAGGDFTAPQGDFVKLSGLKSLLQKINEQLSAKYFTLNGSAAIGNISVRFDDLKLSLPCGLTEFVKDIDLNDLAVSGTIYLELKDKTVKLDVTYLDGDIYAAVNDGIKVKLSESSVLELVDFLKANYQELAQNFNLDELLSKAKSVINFFKNDLSVSSVIGLINEFTVTDGNICLSIDTSVLGLNGILSLNVSVNDNALSCEAEFGDNSFSASIDNSEFQDLTAPTDNYIDLSNVLGYILNNVDFELVADIIDAKTVSFSVNAEINGFALSGNVAINFTEIKAPVVKALFTIDGLDISVFFSDGTLFVKGGNVSLSVKLDDIMDYVSVFTDTPDLSSLISELKSDINAILSSAVVESGKLDISYKNLALSLTPAKLSVSYGDDVTADITDITAGGDFTAPQGDFVKLSGLKSLLQKINEQLSTRYFTANGSIAFGDTAIEFVNIKIINEGDLKDPKAAFDNGDLTLSGTVIINGKHNLFIQYTNKTLYVVYNNEMKVKLSRASLDYIVELLKDNYKAIIQRFNYSEIISADDKLGKIKDYKFTIGSVTKLLQSVSVTTDGGISVTLKAEDFGFTDSAVLSAYLTNGNLALDIVIGDKIGNISLDNTPFSKPAAPTGSFIDLSGVTGLAKAAVNAILKQSEKYYLSGTAKVVMPLGLIDIDVNISMDASVRLVSDGNGGKKIEAVAHVTCRDTTVDTALARSYLKCGKGTLVYKNEKFYITRVNEERKRVLGIPTSTWNTSSTTRRAMTRSYFGENIMTQIGFFMGLGDDILSTFSSSGNSKMEKCLKSYTAATNAHTIVLDGNALTGSSELKDMTLKIGITNEELTSLDVNIPISLSIVNMTATVKLTHNPSASGNFTDANNLNASQFGTVLN